MATTWSGYILHWVKTNALSASRDVRPQHQKLSYSWYVQTISNPLQSTHHLRGGQNHHSSSRTIGHNSCPNTYPSGDKTPTSQCHRATHCNLGQCTTTEGGWAISSEGGPRGHNLNRQNISEGVQADQIRASTMHEEQ